ncbi:MAG: polysaccharide export protein [Sphingobium sp.]|jgi:polysaccharide export outer membrane protein|nr:polysaccharide export protein [Sphingobium sp.]MCI1754681.1 polysaccharide export protein [Sphingobium sp.]MCI2053613.1 polysaccharide export protein [Sphingobium sp.]
MTSECRIARGRQGWRAVVLAALICSTTLSGCAMKSGAGPSTGAVVKADGETLSSADIKIIDVTDDVARRVYASGQASSFAESLGDGAPVGSIVGKGDVLDISIWEAPPAALFGSAGGASILSSSDSTARGTSLPDQMVDSDGRIVIPFIGQVQAAGRTPQQIGREIVSRLNGMAHQPQVIVRVARNATTNVTIVGDVANSTRVPLTARGERVLDVLASAGGVKQPVGKTVIQITRGAEVASLPLEAIIKDPRQNIRLQPDDVVTALFQPYSFTALGATGANAEIAFEATGITLAQALGRAGGLQDQRADVRGAFLFRLEDPRALDSAVAAGARTTPDGKIPVIYRIDMKNPATFFAAQSFPVRNKDVIYVSNAPLAEFQKFVNVVSSLVYPILAINNAAKGN